MRLTSLKRIAVAGVLLAAALAAGNAAEPLRVFIRGGKKSHGPGAHEHEQFLRDWTALLGQRGARCEGAMEFPNAEQLARTDVLIMHAQEGGTVLLKQKSDLDQFLGRGGGIVVIHAAAVSADPAHWKSIVGGSWVQGRTKWLEGPMALYYSDRDHPISNGASNYDMDDEIYYDMDISPDIKVLAAAFTPNPKGARDGRFQQRADELSAGGRRISIYDIQPQMWTYERAIEGSSTPYRAFVHIPGHLYKNFSLPQFRAVLMRGIAWAGKRENVDELCAREELDALRYPPGGPMRPAEAVKQIETHPDFDLKLIASEPLINKVINIDWDADGRLWVAETPEYPNGRRQVNVEPWKDSGSLEKGKYERPARDRISILSDADGDGVMDKKHVFYEGLELVTSFVFHKDGVIICAAPDIISLRDTDRDGKAETVAKVYTGLGIGDTHAVINNMRWGHDGWIYATHGYSASNDVTSGDGARHFGRIGSGVVRFKPDGSAFEQFSSKGGNTWGLDVAWDGEVFYTQPTSGDLLMHVVMPESALARGAAPGTASFKAMIVREKSYPLLKYDSLPYVQIDVVGGFTAAAGCALYDGGAWPAEWTSGYFTGEPTINLVHHQVIEPDGVSYKAHKVPERAQTEFMRGRDSWFRPIETRVGPDGALYLCDFYNQAVIHNDTRGPIHGPANAAVRPDRDHYFGRLYRVQHKKAAALPVPKLAAASPKELAVALEHPNGHVRESAMRLLVESGKPEAAAAVEALPGSSRPTAARLLALRVLDRLGSLNEQTLKSALDDRDPIVRKTAAFVAAERREIASADLVRKLEDPDGRVRLAALLALGGRELDRPTANALVKAVAAANDNWTQSAALGAAQASPALVIEAAFAARDSDRLAAFIGQLAGQLAARKEPAQSSATIIQLAEQPAAKDSLKQAVLRVVARAEGDAPELTPQLAAAMRKLMGDPATSSSVLPLVARWDKGGALTAEVRQQIDGLKTKIADADAGDGPRADAARTLLGLSVIEPGVIAEVVKLLTAGGSVDFRTQVIAALGSAENQRAGRELVTVFPKLEPALRDAAFNQILKRADWAVAFLDASQGGGIELDKLSPGDKDRLRNHPDRGVARRMQRMLAESPAAREKDALIAGLIPAVGQRGNLETGKVVFTATCAICHKFGDLGREVGPTLDGMGAHSPADLLVHIVDPNREVDPSFHAWNIEMKNGELHAGVIARENPKTVVLRTQVAELELAVDQIKSRQNTGRSLMPEGFEALGGEMMRDMLTFISAAETRFRFVDLSKAYTADPRRGLFNQESATGETVALARFGIVPVQGVPFYLADPAKAQGGRSLVVLRGGPGRTFSRSYPQRVEAPVGVSAEKVHFLSGVGGWAWPFGNAENKGLPALKVTFEYAGGATDEVTLRNGEHFADYIGDFDVPASNAARALATRGQMRFFSLPPTRRDVIERIAFESFGNLIAPVVAAVTVERAGDAEKSPPKTAAPTPPKAESPTSGAATSFTWGASPRVLLAGGGSAHDFQKWFNEKDTAILKGAGCSVNYTESPDVAAAELRNADVFVMSTNQPSFSSLGFRKALDGFLASGKGVVFLHPGVWYNFRDWPEFNRVLVGGGSRGHDRIKEFGVSIVEARSSGRRRPPGKIQHHR